MKLGNNSVFVCAVVVTSVDDVEVFYDTGAITSRSFDVLVLERELQTPATAHTRLLVCLCIWLVFMHTHLFISIEFPESFLHLKVSNCRENSGWKHSRSETICRALSCHSDEIGTYSSTYDILSVIST